jgi:tetratricopeptide (TPR) repeat protein
MKTRLGWFACLPCILVGLSVLPSAYADTPPWVEVRSPHFSVATDAGEKRGREVALRFEQMRAVFGTLMVKANVNIPIPLQIVAFRNTKEMRQFAPLWHGKPTQLAGLYQGGEDRSFIMLDMSVENPWSVVFHEYAHQLMNGMLQKQLPPWFEEGFAEFFSSIEVDNKEARVGKIPEQTYQIVQQGVMKIADLFKVRQNSQTYNESGDRRTVFYAESSMLVHYLYDNQLIPKLSLYFDLVTNKNAPVEDAIQQSFGMSAVQFDKVLDNYIRSGRFVYYRLPTPADVANTGYTTTPLSLADSNAILADIHLHSHDYQDKAIAEFQDILKSDPNNAIACRGLGYGYLRKQDYKQAGDYFRRAAQADSKDPRVHYYSALLLSREGGFNNHSDLPEMTKELETAIALDPKYAEPYMLLGFAQAYGGDPAKGLETMQKAISLNPRNTTYQFNLAQMYMNNRKFDQALAVLHALEKIQDQQIALRVSESIRQAEQMKEMFAANQPERSTASDSTGESRSTEMPTLTLRRSERSAQPDPDSPQPETARPESPKPEPTKAEPPKAPVPVRFLQGVLKAVDCSTPPAAVLTVVSGTKTWKLNVTDTNHLVLFGADKFSCSWSKQRVAVNYRDAGNAEGSVVSIEIK